MTAKVKFERMWQLGKGFFGRTPKEVIVEPSQIWGFKVETEDGKVYVNVHSNAVSIVVQGHNHEIATNLDIGLYHKDGVHITGHIGGERIDKDPEYKPVITED